MTSLRERISQSISEPIHSWDAFWFTPRTPHTLGVLRIFAGGMLLYTHLVWGSVLRAYFGPTGWQDDLLVRHLQRDSYAWSFWWYVPLDWYEVVHWSCIVILACFTAGLATRLTSILSFVIAVSYANRAPAANFGLDQINAMLALYLAIGPSGAAYSLDRVFAGMFAALGPLRRGERPAYVAPPASIGAGFAARLVQVHMAILYLWAGLAKLKGEAWWDGSAVWMALANAEYRSADLTFLAWYPAVTELLTHATIAWECTFWVFAFRPRTRPIALLIGIGIHFGIGAFLGLWTFGLVMMIAYLGFVAPETIARCETSLLKFFGALETRAIGYRATSSLSLGFAALRAALRSADTLDFREESRSHMPSIEFPLTADAWRRAVFARSAGKWPFVPRSTGHDAQRPRMLFIARGTRIQNAVQEYFLARGWECRTAEEITSACAMLSVRSCDCLVLLLESRTQIEEFAALREACLTGGEAAPLTIVAKGDKVIDATHDWRPTERHAIHEGPLKMRELRLAAETMCEFTAERRERPESEPNLPRIRRA